MKATPSPLGASLARADRAVGAAMRGLCLFCFVMLLILLSGNVLFRFVPILSMGWYDEIVEILFAWLVFIGSAALWREKGHFRVDWIYAKLQHRAAGAGVCLVIDSLCLLFLLVMTYQGLRLTLLANDWTPILKLPKRIKYVDIPIAGSLMMLYAVRDIMGHIRTLKQNPDG